jgi:hypothetical protein
MLAKKISLNEAVASLENDMHRLLFTWGLSHLDIEGRISGSPKVFRAIVAPLLEHITSEKVAKFFKDAVDKELILRYQVGRDWIVEYPKFKENQRLRADREAPSKLPPPPEILTNTPGELPEDSGETQENSGLKFKLSLNQDKLSLREALSPEATPSPLKNSDNGLNPEKLAVLWNQTAPPILPKVNLPLKRKPKELEKIRGSLKLNPDREWWGRVFGMVGQSPFLLGQNDRQWKASFDFVVNSAELILDGKYAGAGSQPGLAAFLSKPKETPNHETR